MNIIITAPSLNPKENVSGISSVAQFIISNNKEMEYIHFEVGKKDAESTSKLSRIKRILRNRIDWKLLLLQHKDAIIHYNMPLMGAAIIRDYLLLQIAHSLGFPIILHIHGGRLMTNRNRPWFINKLLTLIFSWAKHIIVLSDLEKQIIEEDFKVKNVHTLPNCIDLTEARIFTKDIINKGMLDILYIGRIEPNKGIDYILEACSILKDKKVDFCLHFAGKEENEGEYISKFRERLGDKFKYHGIVSGSPKIDILKKCDIFLLPSFFEGLPMSLLEAMSFGQVPVVTSVGSIPSVVTDMENGVFIEIRNRDSIVNAITRLEKDKVTMQKLSSKAQKTILKKFDDMLYIRKLNTLYNEIAKQ